MSNCNAIWIVRVINALYLNININDINTMLLHKSGYTSYLSKSNIDKILAVSLACLAVTYSRHLNRI
jgi:hypothetical protein